MKPSHEPKPLCPKHYHVNGGSRSANQIAWAIAIVLVIHVGVQFGFGGWRKLLSCAIHHMNGPASELADEKSEGKERSIIDDLVQWAWGSPESNGDETPGNGELDWDQKQREFAESRANKDLARRTRYLHTVVVPDLERQRKELAECQAALPAQTFEYSSERLAAEIARVMEEITANESDLATK